MKRASQKTKHKWEKRKHYNDTPASNVGVFDCAKCGLVKSKEAGVTGYWFPNGPILDHMPPCTGVMEGE